MSQRTVTTLAEVWNRRAREDARYYIKCDLDEQTPERFDESGEEDIQAFVDPWLEHLERRDRALDIGCGIGRLTRPLTRRFAEVDGVDIASEMIDRANAMGEPANGGAKFHVVDGSGTLPFKDDSFDLVFSYIVLQHLPTLALVERYVQESARVLKGGGLAVLQLNTTRRPLLERLTVKLVPSERVPVVHRKLKVKLDPHDSMGVTLTERDCRRLAQSAHLEVLELGPVGEQYTWMVLRSNHASDSSSRSG